MLVLTLAVPHFSVTSTVTQTTGDREIAARFAPVFYQALGDKPRSDYITNFDFDGDWRGDNNWENAANKKFPMLAYIYYSVSETKTHYFIHYAVFHPRDYKGGEKRGRLLSGLIRQGSEIVGKSDPTGMMSEATVAHENDMEGALVVAAKNGKDLGYARIQFVETLQHNAFTRYGAARSEQPGIGTFKTEDERVLLYIEPRGHGIDALTGDEKQTQGKDVLIYRFTGKAGDSEKQKTGPIGYDLLPIQTTLWPKAGAVTKSTTYGKTHDYATVSINIALPDGSSSAIKVKIGGIGSAFLGTKGGENMARPPWGWFDTNRRTDQLGLWFFDPATIIKRDFNLAESFSTTYVRLPFWAIK